MKDSSYRKNEGVKKSMIPFDQSGYIGPVNGTAA